jgi:hypothetical protein
MKFQVTGKGRHAVTPHVKPSFHDVQTLSEDTLKLESNNNLGRAEKKMAIGASESQGTIGLLARAALSSELLPAMYFSRLPHRAALESSQPPWYWLRS